MNTMSNTMVAKPQVTVYSAGKYVQKFMKPIESVCIPHFIESPLSVETAPLARGSKAVNVFVNDDLSAPVLDVLFEHGVETVTLRCAGYDRLNIEYAQKIGMKVYRVPSYSPRSVAELALTHMMALSRNMQLMIPRVNTGNYSVEGLVGSEVTGKVIGLIGTGKIAQEFAMLVKPMAAKIVAYDPYPSPQAEALGVEYHDLSYVLKNSDVVSLHCPLTNDTMHTINRMTLRTMKKNCIIINTARGGLINTPDIIEALENGRIAGVAIDVYEGESELFFENRSDLSMEDRIERWDHNISRLIHLPNTIVSPHVAFLTKTALENIADTTVSNLSDSFSNIASANVVC